FPSVTMSQRKNSDFQRENPQFGGNRRVKGAWWSPRSSKPSSPRLAGRARFDSYPLRRIIFECRLPIVECHGQGEVIFSIANRNSEIEKRVKGGDNDVA